MTQIQLTDQQLNRALAELMGYTVHTYRNGNSVLIGPNLRIVSARECFPSEVWEDAPDFCNDPAASLEVQAKAIEVDARLYAINLAKGLEWDGDGDPLSYSDNDLFSYTGVTVFLLASPRERAEAAYITLQGATD